MLKKICDGLMAGILISIGGAVFLSCDNKYIGAVLFTVALLCICIKGYSLYTGKIGFLLSNHKKEDNSALFLGLFGNAAATVICGFGLRYALPETFGGKANEICTAKLAQAMPETLIRGIFCGILMYLAVSIFREKNNVIGIVFCIPVFILSGFEHSIADIFYFAASGIFDIKGTLFIFNVILGNTIGALILPFLSLAGKKKETEI